MSTPVDPDALVEAVDLLTDGDLLKRISRHSAAEFVEAVAEVSAAARAFLEAPTAEWCHAHWSLEDQPGVCEAKEHDGLVSACEVGRVRLVAERSET